MLLTTDAPAHTVQRLVIFLNRIASPPVVPTRCFFVSYSNSVVKLKNLNFMKNKYCNINNLFFKQINLPRNLNRIRFFVETGMFHNPFFQHAFYFFET